jgi:hypothetical protein
MRAQLCDISTGTSGKLAARESATLETAARESHSEILEPANANSEGSTSASAIVNTRILTVREESQTD